MQQQQHLHHHGGDRKKMKTLRRRHMPIAGTLLLFLSLFHQPLELEHFAENDDGERNRCLP